MSDDLQYSMRGCGGKDGDEYLYSFVLDAGKYDLYIYGGRATTYGKVDLYLDGVAFYWGLERYAATTVTPNEAILYNVVIPTGGRHTIKVKVNGKTGTDYIFGCTAMWFVPGTYASPNYSVKA